jgi:glucose/arabinose dehydrogenase
MLLLLVLPILAACSGPSDREGVDPTATGSNTAEQTPTDIVIGPNQPTATTDDIATTTPATDATTPVSGAETPSVAPTEGPVQPSATNQPDAPTPTTQTQAQTVVDLNSFSLGLEQAGSGFDQPVLVTHAGDGSGRTFVLEKTGAIRLLDGAVYMDISDRVLAYALLSNEHELGLLGLAFHPDYETNRTFFVHYTDQNQDHVVSRFTEGENGLGDPASERILFTYDQPDVNFVGGTVAFGTDGYLYIAMGTGTSVDADQGVSQDLSTLWGKILRIDVNSGDPYGIPADNPFVNTDGARPEVWAYGLRNPWRFDFDPANNDLYIGGPGEFGDEWINFVPGGNAGGLNFGWPMLEGDDCWAESPLPCTTDGVTLPIVSWPLREEGGCVVIGGVVIRGPGAPAAQGAYLYGDYCSGRIWSTGRDANGAWQTREMLDSDMLITSFGKDEQGNPYVTDGNGGVVYRIVVS